MFVFVLVEYLIFAEKAKRSGAFGINRNACKGECNTSSNWSPQTWRVWIKLRAFNGNASQICNMWQANKINNCVLQ